MSLYTKRIAFICIFYIPFFCFGQHPKVDSLLQALGSAKTNKEKVDTYNAIAFEYIYIKFDSIKPNAEKAIALAEKENYRIGIATAKKSLAVYYFFSGDREKSFENIYSSIDLFKKENDTVGIAKAYNNLATLYKNFGELNLSLKAYDTAIYFNEIIGSNKGLINNHINAAGIYVKQGNYGKSLEIYKIAEELNLKENDLSSSASIKSGIGLIYEEQGKFDSAISLLDESLKIFEKLEKSRNVVAMANNLGNIARKKGEYLKSIEYFDMALKSSRKINNPRLEAIILNNLANNYLELNDNPKALELYKESAEIIEGIDDYAYAATLSNIALILQDEDGEDAMKYFKEAYDIYYKMNSRPNLINNLNNQANYFSSIGDYKQAKNIYLNAKTILKNVDTDYLKSNTWLGLSLTNLKLGFIDSAQIYGNEALRLARKTQALSEEAEASDLLYQIAKINGNSKTALDYLELHERLSDSLFNEEKTKVLGKLEAELEFKSLKEKIELERENEKSENNLKLEFKQDLIIALCIIVLGLLIIIILLFILKRNKSKAHERLQAISDELQVKNEKLKKLHVQKNSLISIVSHDFRGPLDNLSQFLDLYINKELTEKEFEVWLPEIRRSVNSTQKLIGSLLNWAKQSLNEFQVNKEDIDLYESSLELIDSYKKQVEEKGISVINEIPVNSRIYMDKNTLDLVMRNLFINSIKYCNTNDSIKLSFKEEKKFSIVCIEDTGVGMKKETAEKLFKREDLISAIGTGKEKGSGIGAVLAKNFLDENDGDIWVDHTEIGRGTRICFKVPVKP